MKFRKKPVEIEAFHWTENTGVCWNQFRLWLGTIQTFSRIHRDNDGPGFGCSWTLFIYTLEGKMKVSPGDWIICGVEGELYPCKPDIFELTYEAV